MAPISQDHTSAAPEVDINNKDGERVVISGMSGLYPESHHVKDLSDILYNKVNPVSGENLRWKYNHPEAAKYTGKVPDLDRFDAQFFKVHYRLGHNMDSMARKILEQAYQAIYDAGVSPEHLSGRKVGVYIGTCFSETEKACFYVASSKIGLGIAGCSKTMYANRISYWLNAKGPSLSIDEACCSSIAALEQAYLAMSRGECEAAIVGGSNLCLHPQSSVHYSRLMKMCMDGKTKSFDQDADGCAKSEAINVLFLQKAKDALRIYADVLHVKSEFTSLLPGETGPRYGFYRDPIKIANFIEQFYNEASIPPQMVEYVEAFGSAVPEADKAELEAIEKVFCKNRDDPLFVGSVMSNIGYGEGASGISAITKVLLGYQKGKLASNMHCATPRQDIAALRDGRMRIVTEHQPFRRTYTAINAMSVTGVNAHVLLHGHYKPKDPTRYKSNIPHLVTISGRQESAVNRIFKDLKSRCIDPEELALLHNIHETRISGHLGRGFIILDTNEDSKTISVKEKVDYFDDATKPLWFVYSGMGSQWAGMGAQLMRIPIFAAAIERCRRVLQPKGIDIIHIITSPDKAIFDNILHSFVGIAAIQIGLTDILYKLGLVPDKIIGHSVGELGCAYADGCFTTEEMILSAYSRGLVSLQTPFIKGSMAAVGMGYQQILPLCPSEIEIACHNGPESCTISGPADKMREFVAELTSKNIFAKEVPCSNIAYHSRYIAGAGPGLLKYLKEVIKNPKPRSERWVSTSVPQDKWNEPAAMYSSAEYHTNNLLNPVLFEEISRLIPSNAVVVEVAPHGLLQAILKRSLPTNCCNIALTRRGHTDNVQMILEAVGKLYMEGYHPKVKVLYPKVEFPVSSETPLLSHLVEWVHNEKWSLPLYVSAHRKQAAASQYIISIHDEEHSYLRGHMIKGKTLYPFSAALVAVWDTLAMSLGTTKNQLSVEYNDIHLHSQPVLHDQRQLRLSVALHRGTGRFEVMDDISTVATGFIAAAHFKETKKTHNIKSSRNGTLNSDEVYHMLSERDYSYSGAFRSIYEVHTSMTEAQIVWSNNWVTFIDGLLQLNMLRHSHKTVSLPIQIRRLCIDVTEHTMINEVQLKEINVLKANINDVQDNTCCGGVLIENIKFRNLAVEKEEQILLQTLKFIPRFHTKSNMVTALHSYLQIVAENVNKTTIKVVGLKKFKDNSPIFDDFEDIVNNVSGIKIQYKILDQDIITNGGNNYLTGVDMVLVQHFSQDNKLYQILNQVLKRNTFLVNEEKLSKTSEANRLSDLYHVVSSHSDTHRRLELAFWRPTSSQAFTSAYSVRTESDLAFLSGRRVELARHKLLLLASYPPLPGLKDLVKKWRKEPEGNQIYVIMVNHKIEENQNLEQLPNVDLAFSILDHGTWGGEYYVPAQEMSTVKGGAMLQSARIGDIDSLQWVEVPEPAESGIAVNVHYAGINHGDVQKAVGVIPFKHASKYGMDFSGVTDSGMRVMGIVSGGACCQRVRTRPELLWPVPAHWSLEDAATVPLAYALAFYCLNIKLKCSFLAKTNILVHGGAGALGQAAISVALASGYEVFTTVSDVHKKQFLRKLFPEIKEEHIGNSRDHSFGDMVLAATNGEGCDIVISCVKGSLKNTSLKCCAQSGVTIDTTQLLNQDTFSFGMYNLTKDRAYLPIDFASILANGNVDDMKLLQGLVSEGVSRGWVRPLSRVTYAPHDAPRAFRLLAASEHRGRMLLDLTARTHTGTTNNNGIAPKFTQPKLICNQDLSSLIVCNDGILGLQLADRLISRGAKKLVLHCLQQQLPYYFVKIRTWKNTGVEVTLSSEDLNSSNNVIKLLEDTLCSGPIEGIYLIATASNNTNAPEASAVLADLDTASRKLCPTLRYFAVIGTSEAVGLQTCLTRAQDRLPVTKLTLPSQIVGYEDTSRYLAWNKFVVEATERALRSAHTILRAQPQGVPTLKLLQQVAAIADIAIPEDVTAHTTLEDLGTSNEKLQIIDAFLRDNHNICLSEEQILMLSLEKINQLDKRVTDSDFEDVKGLSTFFSYVDADELLATTEMVFVPTLTSSTTVRVDEFDVDQIYLCIVPGMDGHHDRFRVMCERLKLPALVLQPGFDRLHETVKETAERFAKVLLKKAGLKNNFYVLGYESGVLVALEIVAILEEHGLTGTVFCIGSGPDEFHAVLEEQLSQYGNEEQLQEAVLRHMFTLMTKSNTSGLERALHGATTWEQKVEVCVRTLLGHVAHSAQYARALIEGAYMKIKKVRSYTAQPQQLRSRLVLLQTAGSQTSTTTLQRYSKQQVIVHQLRAPLAYATMDLRCAAIINQHLQSEIKVAFEKKNHCETYLLNADTFMTNATE